MDYSKINLLETAVINKNLVDRLLGAARITNVDYQAGNIKSKVSCDAEQCFVILSESYFPGWKAYVDGKKQTLYKVNDLIMGVFVGQGEHIIRFYYFPNSVMIGLILFIFGLIWVPIWMLRSNS